MEALSVLKHFPLPSCEKIEIEKVLEGDAQAEPNEFLLRSVTGAKAFVWNSALTDMTPVNIDGYVSGLQKALKTVTDKVVLSYWSFSKASLEAVVKSSCNCSMLVITSALFCLDRRLDFSGPEYSLTCLGLMHCGDWVGQNWSDRPDRILRLVKAIAGSKLKDSLKLISFHYCGVKAETVKKMLAENGMAHVQVTEERLKFE